MVLSRDVGVEVGLIAQVEGVGGVEFKGAFVIHRRAHRLEQPVFLRTLLNSTRNVLFGRFDGIFVMESRTVNLLPIDRSRPRYRPSARNRLPFTWRQVDYYFF